jgi:hypothetical protein
VDAIQTKHRRTPAGDESAAMRRTALDMLRKAGRPTATTETAERIIVAKLPKVVQSVTFRNGVEVTDTPEQTAA